MNNIIELFQEIDNDSLKKVAFNSIIIICIILFVFTRILFYNSENKNDTTVVLKGIFVVLLIIVGVWISSFYISHTKEYTKEIKLEKDIYDDNKMIDYKLNCLQDKIYEYITKRINLINNTNTIKINKSKTKLLYEKNKLDSLYIDANLIVFLFSIISLYNYNPAEFYLLLKGTNNILKIRRQIEEYYNANKYHIQNIEEMFEIAIELKTRCINHLHNFIYSIPKMKIMYEYVNKCIETYAILINNNLDKIQLYTQDYIKHSGITTKTRFINYHKKTKPFNYGNNTGVFITKKQHTYGINKELQDLYT
jgi:hypothetical protein